MDQHPKVAATMVAAPSCFGVGAGGTPNIAGTNNPLVERMSSLICT
jgi:5-aminolevulinate synthase